MSDPNSTDKPQAQQALAASTGSASGNQNPQVCCFRCLKWFRLPQTIGTDPYPIQCLHCGYMHTYHDAKLGLWPIEIYDRPKR